jgi:hypothetical protein
MKKLHEFKVSKKIVKKIEEKTEEGTLVKDVISSEDVGVYIKLPGRREMDQMRMVNAAEVGKALAMGIQSREAMRTAIMNQGGFAYAKADLEELDKLLPELNKKRNQYQLLKSEGCDTTEIEKEFQELYAQVQLMESRLLEVYEHSAETIAERETVLWSVLSLLYWNNGSLVFSGHTEETRKNKYYEAADSPEEHEAENAAFQKAYLLIDAYLFKGIPLEKIAEFAELIDSQ